VDVFVRSSDIGLNRPEFLPKHRKRRNFYRFDDGLYRIIEQIERNAKINQGTEHHIAADSRRTIQIGKRHTESFPLPNTTTGSNVLGIERKVKG
jgi:hypothetical protein